MDLHLLVTSLHPLHKFRWSNVDELSSLWAVFTKCKRNIRNGFRLENLSWRLWARHTIQQRRRKPATFIGPKEQIDDMGLTIESHAKDNRLALKRSQSLPNLPSLPAATMMTPPANATLLTTQSKKSSDSSHSKFFIDDDEEEGEVMNENYEDDAYYDEYYDESMSVGSLTSEGYYGYDTPADSVSTCSSPPASLADKPFFEKQAPAAKPISLLSVMLKKQQQQQQQHQQPQEAKTSGLGMAGGLKRCQSQTSHLDRWFLQAA
ncbi:hypothetical protein BCR43DRAFT_498956 [Syncephalastrum racemosum]|uniref:Nitrogen regulatory protein areA GATA-like domain-containing protein n=1 Tax=Syncephalastrum racemosum TaxID=13706 RepID=A0A1X2H1R7_SYNRA|nr:hypothetical protein BCR43DRAFT_498956 [Syncephalastrum racemosum]